MTSPAWLNALTTLATRLRRVLDLPIKMRRTARTTNDGYRYRGLVNIQPDINLVKLAHDLPPE
jgi:hypothetical protein